jgi:hypothetical protein
MVELGARDRIAEGVDPVSRPVDAGRDGDVVFETLLVG